MIELVIGIGAVVVLFWVATRKPKVENKEVKAAVQAVVCAEAPKVVEATKAPAKRTVAKKATPAAKKPVAKPAAKKPAGRKPKK